MTEPTDDELDAVIAEYRTRIYPQDMHPRFERAIMRDAIAKWGAPQAGAVPLTNKQVAEIADAAHREYDRLVGSGQCAPRWSAVFAHLLERAHGIGIKGGQHGTE